MVIFTECRRLVNDASTISIGHVSVGKDSECFTSKLGNVIKSRATIMLSEAANLFRKIVEQGDVTPAFHIGSFVPQQFLELRSFWIPV
jgi:hypothetical protein